MMIQVLAAITFSTLLILALCLGDPKRRRTARRDDKAQSRTMRLLLVPTACLPILWFTASGDAAALLLWLGACTANGWLITMALSE
jgi:hypothetical protein